MLKNFRKKEKNQKTIAYEKRVDSGICIDVENLNLYYDKVQALFDVNMKIPSNCITAFIGPSGCGKSTLLKTFNRMNDLIASCRIEGKVFIEGENIYDKTTQLNALRKNVGMVFQKPNPFPLSVYDNIAYAPRTFGIRKKADLDEIVFNSLTKAAMWEEVKDRLHKSALSLSGGQQQRLCIARCLSAQPKVILMDEATSALDPLSSAKIEELAMELKRQYSVVIVTHNMQQAMRISDKTAFFFLGKLIEFSDTANIFSNPEKEETERYITGRFG